MTSMIVFKLPVLAHKENVELKIRNTEEYRLSANSYQKLMLSFTDILHNQ